MMNCLLEITPRRSQPLTCRKPEMKGRDRNLQFRQFSPDVTQSGTPMKVLNTELTCMYSCHLTQIFPHAIFHKVPSPNHSNSIKLKLN